MAASCKYLEASGKTDAFCFACEACSREGEAYGRICYSTGNGSEMESDN